jgi:peptide methionine sulfoxide reductase MsrB
MTNPISEYTDEYAGVEKSIGKKNKKITFYDTITNKPLFQISNYRDVKDFKEESEKHGWPSFRDGEVIWENVRSLENGEIISIDDTHLGHNIPDKKGNRYCINIVSISGLG